jgi:glutamyl-tRNA reductase
MKLQMIGCSHHTAAVDIRERLAFTQDEVPMALERFRLRHPESEVVLLSTCNRVEVYLAASSEGVCPSHRDVVEFVADFHGLNTVEVFEDLFERTGEDAIRHLFTVAASLDSMVVGEAQILSQVKQAYEVACAGDHAGPVLNLAFQRAIRVARRVATETAIHQKRVSIPSVAVADFASQIFERFDDKRVVVAGAGEMAEETLRYLMAQGARQVVVLNRTLERAQQLAHRMEVEAAAWETLQRQLLDADLFISAVGAAEPIITAEMFKPISRARAQRPLFMLDLAVPRNIDREVAQSAGVYLYSLDDLRVACERNRRAREKELPKAARIVDDETRRFMAELSHRATGPTIRRLKDRADELKGEELARLMNKLGEIDSRIAAEISRSFDRLVNKLLHPPLESLRDQAEKGTHHGLLDALRQLFKLKE